jgi:hypothetical protein
VLTQAAANDWAWYWSPSQINFLIFTSVWTLLALAYLIITPGRFPTAAHKYGILAAEAVTMLFWFADFIALAVLLTNAGCSAHSGRYWGPCRAAIAGDVFAAFEWYVDPACNMWLLTFVGSYSRRLPLWLRRIAGDREARRVESVIL